jgi:predicted nucleotidyltransferase
MKNGKNTMKNKQKDKDDILRVIREIHSELASRFTVRRIGVFGSFAKGGEGTESDVDIIVELAKPTFDNYMDLKFRLEDVLKLPVDLVMADTVKPRIKPIIEQEVIYA